MIVFLIIFYGIQYNDIYSTYQYDLFFLFLHLLTFLEQYAIYILNMFWVAYTMTFYVLTYYNIPFFINVLNYTM